MRIQTHCRANFTPRPPTRNAHDSAGGFMRRAPTKRQVPQSVLPGQRKVVAILARGVMMSARDGTVRRRPIQFACVDRGFWHLPRPPARAHAQNRPGRVEASATKPGGRDPPSLRATCRPPTTTHDGRPARARRATTAARADKTGRAQSFPLLPHAPTWVGACIAQPHEKKKVTLHDRADRDHRGPRSWLLPSAVHIVCPPLTRPGTASRSSRAPLTRVMWRKKYTPSLPGQRVGSAHVPPITSLPGHTRTS